MSKILFSPIGGTDPVSNYRDGALIHICRVYKPSKVYLYLSKEIYENHINDNRYVYCLEMLKKQVNIDFEIKIIEKPELTEVQKLDYYFEDFKSIIRKINIDNPDCEILLNVSSGTPAMKYTLQVISALNEFSGKVKPIQVATPNKKINKNIKAYDVEEEWICDEDNKEDFENRCEISNNSNLLSEIKKESLINLINNYDYFGAFELAKEIRPKLNEIFIELLTGACRRISLDFKSANDVFKKNGVKLLLTEQVDIAKITEYILKLNLTLKSRNYVDFYRGITPVFKDLLLRIVDEKCKIKLSDYTTDDMSKWSENKLQGTEILNILNTNFNNNFNTRDYVKSEHLIYIIESYCQNEKKLIDEIKVLRDVEKAIRNDSAHEIVSITDEDIEKRTKIKGLNSQKILDYIIDLSIKSKVIKDKSEINSYDDMNKVLVDYMSK